MNILEINDVTYHYEGTNRDVLKRVNATFEEGIVYAIVGKSGSGKSTLLSLIAGLDVATVGEIAYGGVSLEKLDRDAYRAKDIGVIFQGFNLLTNATALENIVLSMEISGKREKNHEKEALKLLAQMGIDESTAKRKVLKLSGGQQQRIAIARALAHHPNIILADEPTGNLDGATESDVMAILTKLAHEENKCVIIITHSDKVAKCADVIYTMKGGVLA